MLSELSRTAPRGGPASPFSQPSQQTPSRAQVLLASPRDVRLAERAERVLHQQDFRFSRCVTCECRDGVLILEGRVPSYYLKQLAQATVAEIPEVKEIENRLDVFVSTQGPPRRPR